MPADDIIQHTIGRATNAVLEAATAVWFKDEDEVDGEPIGPIWIAAEDGRLVPFNRGEAEWFPYSFAEALAGALGVELVTS